MSKSRGGGGAQTHLCPKRLKVRGNLPPLLPFFYALANIHSLFLYFKKMTNLSNPHMVSIVMTLVQAQTNNQCLRLGLLGYHYNHQGLDIRIQRLKEVTDGYGQENDVHVLYRTPCDTYMLFWYLIHIHIRHNYVQNELFDQWGNVVYKTFFFLFTMNYTRK